MKATKIVVLLATCMLLANCSRTPVSGVDLGENTAFAAKSESAQQIQSSFDPDTPTSAPNSNPTPQTGSGTSLASNGSTAAGSTDSNLGGGGNTAGSSNDEGSGTAADNSNGSSGGGSQIGGGSQVTDASDSSKSPSADSDIIDGTAACKSKDGMPLSDLASIENLHGSFVFNAVSSVKNVNNVGGKLVIIGQGQGSRIESVSNFGGKLVICNMNVASIEHTNGVIVLVNSSVGSVVDHRGQIKTVK